MQSIGISLLVVVAVLGAMFGPTPCTGQTPFLGGCPSQAVVQDFNVSEYLGLWYENRKYYVIFEDGQRCITAKYSQKDNGDIGIINQGINSITGPQKAVGSAKLAKPQTNEAKLTVSFSPIGDLFEGLFNGNDGNYWVLDTDYTTYSIVWACQNAFIINTQELWLLTREQYPDQSLVKSALDFMQGRGLDISKLLVTDHTNC